MDKQIPTSKFNLDCFASGQIGSKLWLVEQLEKLKRKLPSRELTIWVLGGWYGLLPFLLLSRGSIKVKRIISFDINSQCKDLSEQVNNFWHWQNGKFIAWEKDCNHLNYNNPGEYWSDPPDLVINTSTEHFDSDRWWEAIPSGTRVILQCCDLTHVEHCNTVKSELELLQKYPLAKKYFAGSLEFKYGNSSDFNRFMVIGNK